MLKKILLLCLFFLLGVGSGIGVIKITSPQIPIEEILHSPLGKIPKRPQVIGFLPYWLINKTKDSYANKITTLAYYALTIGEDGKIQKLVNQQEEEPGWTTLKKATLTEILAQAKSEKLNTSLLIFTVDEEDINNLITNPQQSAQNLMSDVSSIMQQHNFTDLNMDIESFTYASPSSQLNYAQFLKEVKKNLKENNLGTLTVDITPESLIKPRLTEVSQIANIADYIVLMGYDYHYIYSRLSGPVGPIGGAGLIREYDVETAVKIALEKIPPEKLILGIPLYGYEWDTLTNQPIAGVIPGSGKTASTRRIDEEILKDCSNCIKGIDETGQQPYVIIPEEKYFRQIFYEDKDSLAKKLEFAKNNKLGGVALWALGYEDSEILNPLTSYK